MSRTKVKELVDRPVHDRSTCPSCSPKKDRLREDQVWGICPMNRPHPANHLPSRVRVDGVLVQPCE